MRKTLVSIICLTIFLSFFTAAYGEKIDINSAKFEVLITLPGINELMAAKIYKYRESHPFKSIYDLMKIDGMSGEIFQKIVNKIKVGKVSSSPEKKISKSKPLKKIRNENKPISISNSSGLSSGRRKRNRKISRISTSGRIGSTSSLRRISRHKFTPMSIFKAAFGLARRGKFKMAEKLFTQFLKQNPTHKYSSDAKYLSASCYEEMGMYKKAIELYNLVYNNRYSRIRGIALFRIGICYDMLKDYENALKNYNKFLSEFPQSQWSKMVIDRLKELN